MWLRGVSCWRSDPLAAELPAVHRADGVPLRGAQQRAAANGGRREHATTAPLRWLFLFCIFSDKPVPALRLFTACRRSDVCWRRTASRGYVVRCGSLPAVARHENGGAR